MKVTVTTYKCDYCKERVEEAELTDALLALKGRVVGRHRLDLCVACAERLTSVDAEDDGATLPEPRRHNYPQVRRRQRTQQEVAAAVAEGRSILKQGAALRDVLSKLEVTRPTWARWNARFPVAVEGEDPPQPE